MKLIKSALGTASFLASATFAFAQTSTTLNNPTNIQGIGNLFDLVFRFLIGIVGGLAIIFLIIGGIRYILARGDEKAAKGAKDQITAAIIGLVIALLAVAIVIIIGNLFNVSNLNVVDPKKT